MLEHCTNFWNWPLPLFGTQLFPLTSFGKCGEHDATVEHALCACRCTKQCYNVLRTEAAMVPPRWCGQAVLFFFSNDTMSTKFRDLLQLVFTSFGSFSYFQKCFWHKGKKQRRHKRKVRFYFSHWVSTSKRYFLPAQTVTSERLDHVAVGACPFIVRVWNWFIWSVDPFRSGRNCKRQLSWYHTMQGLLPSFKTDVSEQTLCDLALSWASQRMGPNWTFICHFSVPENMVYTHVYPHSWPILSERWSRMMINHRNLGVS